MQDWTHGRRRLQHLHSCCRSSHQSCQVQLGTVVDELLAEYEGSNPGASVLVVQHGNIVLRHSYGLADCIRGVRVETGSNFRLASVTKQFTAVAILLLREDGALQLSDSLCDIFPDFPEYGREVQVHHLLQHTSGLRDYFGLLTTGRTKQVTDAEVLQMIREQPGTDFPPGSTYSYSNTGYCVLAEIIAAVSGQSYSSFLGDRIFRRRHQHGRRRRCRRRHRRWRQRQRNAGAGAGSISQVTYSGEAPLSSPM